jgi:hypothetical protein
LTAAGASDGPTMAADGGGGGDSAREKLGRTRCCAGEVEDEVGEALAQGIGERRPVLAGINDGASLLGSTRGGRREGRVQERGGDVGMAARLGIRMRADGMGGIGRRRASARRASSGHRCRTRAGKDFYSFDPDLTRFRPGKTQNFALKLEFRPKRKL